MLGVFGIEPPAELLSRQRAEVRRQRMQFPQRRARAFLLAELPIHSGQRRVCETITGHVELQGYCQRAAIVPTVVRIVEGGKMIPAGMMRVELRGPLY